jgi:hypothetical protein
MNKNWIIVIVVVAAMFFLFKKNRYEQSVVAEPVAEIAETRTAKARPTPEATPVARVVAAPLAAIPPKPVRRVQEIPKSQKGQRKDAASYVMDEGLIVIQGDLVVGAPTDENAEPTGLVAIPKVTLWPTNVIPYHIQPGVKNPERVHAALALFNDTAVHFVPYTNQPDALVFEDSTGSICKSYVGRIGGLQPVWLPPGCEAPEIAHEIMHALGFVHEQNRTDRDQFINVDMNNIQDEQKANFDLLPPDMMKLSGLDSFDFESIMIYPTTMFAKNTQQPTMTPKLKTNEIRPSEALSAKDISRINRAFSR